MDVHLDQLIGPFEQFRSEDDNWGGAITDFWVLKLCKLDEQVGDWMLDLELF